MPKIKREGRIHRYKGHAVRKNVAAAFSAEALAKADGDVWETVFGLGHDRRAPEKNDLVPYWILGGDAKSGMFRRCRSAERSNGSTCGAPLRYTGWFSAKAGRRT